VHRYSKAQQDALLPHVEAGTIVLVGATTEAPFGGGIIRPLLSRLRVFRLEPLGDAELRVIADRALADAERGLGSGVTLDEVALRQLVGYASGDGRRLLGILEAAVAMAGADGRTAIEPADIARAAQSATLDYDRSGVVSAFIKSIRGSDPDAALYWLATALEAGEDPRYLARRLVISASEDVGNAEPRGLPLAVAALGAVERIGAETNDEGLYALAQATAFLATAPKSPAAGRAFFAAREVVRAEGTRPVPGHLRPVARTYRNPHDDPSAADQDYLPRGLSGRRFYEPRDAGDEAAIRDRLEQRRGRPGRGDATDEAGPG
jgi:putative ATPase